MNIALPYENGEIFPHFGKAKQFKIYRLEDGRVVDAQVVTPEDSGHEAVAEFLHANEVEAVLCGRLGEGMQNALDQYGIGVLSGLEGDADEAVRAWLNGSVSSAGVNCHHEEGSCGCGGSCGSSCGGGCGCHGGPTVSGKNAGKTVRVHYRGTLNDGTQFDASYDRGEPLEFVCGAGMMIPGFDAAVADMDLGQEIDIHLLPEEAYGPANPGMVFSVEIAQLPGSEDLSIGEQVYLYDQTGRPFPVKVVAKEEPTITFDANHELAGQELNFHIELLSAE